MQHSLPLIVLISFAAGCTLINEGRFSEEMLDASPDTEQDASDGCDEECEEPLDGPGVTSFTTLPEAKTSTTAIFHFASSVGFASFECALDQMPFAPCSSPMRYDDLEDGTHLFRVRAIGEDGAVEEPPLEHEWLVDSTVLDTFFTSTPAPKTGKTASFEFDGTLALSFECMLEPSESAYSPCTSPKVYTGLFTRDGGYKFSVRAIGEGGAVDESPATHSFEVDSIGPYVTIAGTPGFNSTTNSWDVNLTFVANEEVERFECSINGQGYHLCSSPYTAYKADPGPNTLHVRAVDLYGNTSPSHATWTWTVVPRSINEIKTIRIEPIATGTWVTIDPGYSEANGTRITFIDSDVYERYWVQQTDGALWWEEGVGKQGDNTGIMVYPLGVLPLPTHLGRSPHLTGVVRRSAAGEVYLDRATTHYDNSNQWSISARFIDRSVSGVLALENQGLLVQMGGRLRSGNGGCLNNDLNRYIEACNGIPGGGSKVVCIHDASVDLSSLPVDDWFYADGIPVWTDDGVRLLLTDVSEGGSDVCL